MPLVRRPFEFEIIKNMKKIAFFALFLTLFQPIFGQSYKTAFGVRLGDGIGFSLNQHLFESNTLEIIARPNLTNSQRFGISAIFKNHHQLLTRATNWYIGGGGHYYFNKSSDASDFQSPAGITGIFGVEATLRKLNFSFDWKPEVHLIGDQKNAFSSGAGFSIRYVFAKRERKKLIDRKIFKRKK
jgi:hypothetical protein